MLETFVAVADEGGFTKAAERLHLVQSSVSASIKSLERQVGFALFERGTRSVRLTAEGRALLEVARSAVEAMKTVHDAADELGTGVAGAVSVGVLVIPDSLGIAAAVGRMHDEYPAVRIHVRTAVAAGSRGLVEDVLDGTLDMTFVALPAPFLLPPEIAIEPLAQGRYVLVCGPTHPWAGRTDDIPAADFEGVDFVDFPAGFSLRRLLDERFADAGLRRRIHVEVADLQLIGTYIAAGLGVGLVTDTILTLRDDLVPLRSSWLDMEWTIAIATHRRRRTSRAGETFLAAIRENTRRAIADGIASAPG